MTEFYEVRRDEERGAATDEKRPGLLPPDLGGAVETARFTNSPRPLSCGREPSTVGGTRFGVSRDPRRQTPPWER